MLACILAIHGLRNPTRGLRVTDITGIEGVPYSMRHDDLGLAFFPNVVPFKINLWRAASGIASHVFLLIGAGLVTPVVLGYSAFAYSVFRGKTPAEGWEP